MINKYKHQLAGLFRRNKVAAAYLFGSYAKEDSGPLSDVDMAFLLTPGAEQKDFFDTKLTLNYALAKILRRNKIDVVILNEAFPSLRFRIINEGKIIFDNAPRLRRSFEAKTLVDYMDTKSLREEYNEYLFRNLKTGGGL